MATDTPIYLSRPGVVCSAGFSIEEVFSKSLEGSNSGLTAYTIPNGKHTYAGHVDETSLEEASYPFSMKTLKLEETALKDLSSLIGKAISTYGKDRIGVCVGSCDNGSGLSVPAHKHYFETGAFPDDYDLSMQSASLPAEYISNKYSLGGPVLGFATACSSGGSALIKGAQFIRSGLCDAVIAGGVDLASDTDITGFGGLEAISDEKTIPFSANRKGINLGDGCGLFLLSKDNLSEEEPVYLLGWGESSDASHMTAPKADGSGAAAAMAKALKHAGLDENDIDYINLHGTGTHLNDSMEALAVKTVFPHRFEEIPVSSTKGIMGHTLGAAGAIEAALCYQIVHIGSSLLPVHVFDGARESEMPHLNFVLREKGLKNPAKICLSNSFAFGGCNVSLIIGKIK